MIKLIISITHDHATEEKQKMIVDLQLVQVRDSNACTDEKAYAEWMITGIEAVLRQVHEVVTKEDLTPHPLNG